jgi:hypothetical protein
MYIIYISISNIYTTIIIIYIIIGIVIYSISISICISNNMCIYTLCIIIPIFLCMCYAVGNSGG